MMNIKKSGIVRHLLLAVAALAATAILTGFISAATSDTEIVPGDVGGDRRPLTAEEAQVLLPAIRVALQGGRHDLKLPAGALASRTAPCAVLVSVSNGRATARVALGRGDGLVAAVEHALAEVPAFRGDALDTCWVKLDLVTSLKRLETVSRNFELDPHRGHEGIALIGAAGSVILPEVFFVSGRVSGNMLRLGTAISNLAAEQPERWTQLVGRATYAIRRFRTDAWFSDGGAVAHLHEGRRLLADLDLPTLDDAAAHAGDYLTHAVGADGRFVYLYNPQTDETSSSYNVLRHAGSTWALLELAKTSKDASLRDAAKRAIGNLLTFVHPAPGDARASCVVEGTKIKLGGAALAVLALVRYQQVTGDGAHEPVTRALGRYILSGMTPAGRFEHHEKNLKDGKNLAFHSGYFDGEAILALLELHALTREATWLAAAAQAVRYVITVRDAKLTTSELTADHWMLYALRGLYQREPNELYLRHALRIAESITMHQSRAAGSRMRLGGTPGKCYSTPVATRTEGLVQAYWMARAAGKKDVCADLLKSIHLGLAFELAHQFRPETALYFKDPARVLGGFPSSFENASVRNDYVQHNLSAMLLVRDLIVREGLKSLDRNTSPAAGILDERNQMVWAK